MQFYSFLCAFICFFCSHTDTPTITPTSYIGKWKIEGGSVIELYQKDQLFYGKICKRTANPRCNLNGLDNKNPDKTLRSRSLIGIDIINNLSYDTEDQELSGGTIYNADSGKTYTVKMWITTDDVNTCFIRAYKGFLFKTFTATRVLEHD